MRLRQIALVARDLERAKQDLEAVFGFGTPFADPGVGTFGLENAVYPVGDTFVEVVSPKQAGTSAGRFLDRRGGDSGYMVIVQSEDLAVDRARVADLGVRVVWETEFPDIATLHLHPRDVGGAILSLDVADPPGSWRWGGPDWEGRSKDDVSCELAAAEMRSPDPGAMAQHWGNVLARDVAPMPSGGYRIALDRGEIRFVEDADPTAAGLGRFDLAVRDLDRVHAAAAKRSLVDADGEIRVCGTSIGLVSA